MQENWTHNCTTSFDCTIRIFDFICCVDELRMFHEIFWFPFGDRVNYVCWQERWFAVYLINRQLSHVGGSSGDIKYPCTIPNIFIAYSCFLLRLIFIRESISGRIARSSFLLIFDLDCQFEGLSTLMSALGQSVFDGKLWGVPIARIN